MLSKYGILILITVFGCAEVQPETVSYFDLPGLLDQQIHQLTSDYQLEKTVIIDGVSETKILTPDSAGWVDELAGIKEFSISEPAMRGSYDEQSLADSKRFQLLANEKSPVLFLEIKNTDSATLITSKRLAEKTIFTDEKELTVTLKKEVLENYRIQGFQKMVMKDTIHYEIIGKVLAK